jgi:hypothetical protein
MLLTIDDLNTHLYPEIIETITRDEASLVQDAIDAAELEAISYLERFDTDELFNRTDNDRDKMLLLYLKDMTVWNLLALSNPDTDVDFREARYKNALNWLQKIQGGKATPKGWVLSSVTTTNEPFIVSSDAKRKTSF